MMDSSIRAIIASTSSKRLKNLRVKIIGRTKSREFFFILWCGLVVLLHFVRPAGLRSPSRHCLETVCFGALVVNAQKFKQKMNLNTD